MISNITKFEEVEKVIRSFKNGLLKQTWIVSPPGLGKSFLAKEILGEETVFFTGHITPMAFYYALFEHKDKLLVFDDLDAFIQEKKNTALLKQLVDVNGEKATLEYHTSINGGEPTEAPSSFETTSRCLFLSNQINQKDADAKAFMDRLHIFRFTPTNKQVCEYLLGTKDLDKEVFRAYKKATKNQSIQSLRVYYTSVQLKKAGFNWKKQLLEAMNHPKIVLLKSLLLSYKTDLERLECWKGGRRDYYNWKRFLKICTINQKNDTQNQ